MTDAFDSDVLILAASGDEAGAVARAAFALGGPAIGSVLLLPEILSKPLRLGWKVELEALTDLLAHIELKEVDVEIAQASVAVGAKYGLRAADAVHLATAIVWGADRFHSNNRKDFGQRISEIDVIVPNPA